MSTDAIEALQEGLGNSKVTWKYNICKNVYCFQTSRKSYFISDRASKPYLQ